MNDKEFRTFLNLMMVSDPWPLSKIDNELMEGFANNESVKRGFDNWIVAYHEHMAYKL